LSAQPAQPRERGISLPHLKLAAQVWGEDGLPPLLAVHGWLDNAGSFARLAPLLAGHFQVIALDLPGHGHSQHLPAGMGYHYSDHVRTLLEVLDALQAERIHVLAQRRAFPVACYLSYAIAQLELPVLLLDGVGGMLREQARAMRPGDVLVAVSFRNYSPDVIESAADAHRRRVDVVVITDSAVSPLAGNATVAFDLGDPSDRPFRSLVEPMCLAQALVVSVGHELAKPAKPGPGTGQVLGTGVGQVRRPRLGKRT
jgi:pimeloyl-ACP methyl ester carboxylesterase